MKRQPHVRRPDEYEEDSLAVLFFTAAVFIVLFVVAFILVPVIAS